MIRLVTTKASALLMSDSDVVRLAYQEHLQSLFIILVASNPASDPLRRFRAGLIQARATRDAALVLVEQKTDPKPARGKRKR